MPVTQSQLLAKQTRIWIGFLLFSLRRFWWLVLPCIIFGTTWGYITTLGTANVYEASASFVMPGEDASIEYERLLSRSLVTKYIAQDKRFEVATYVQKSWRPPLELYNESPFQIRIVAFPEHLKDLPHQIRLLDSSHFEITIAANEQKVVTSGEVGILVENGSTRLLVEATDFWNKNAPGFEYTFVVRSQERLASRVMHQLSLEHPVDHPNRITLHYSEENAQLALDILGGFTQGYLKESKLRREEMLRERLAALQGELKSLEIKMLASDDMGFWTNLSQQSLIAQDSAVVDMLKLRKEMEDIQKRQRLWAEFKKGRLLPEALGKSMQTATSRPGDSVLLAIVARYANASGTERNAAYQAIDAMVDSLDRSDAAWVEAIDGRIVDVNAGMMGSAVLAAAWRKQPQANEPSASPFLSILLERYLAVMAQAAEIELETRKETQEAQLIDPPYLMPGHGRGLKLRKMLAWIVGMAMLGLLLSIVLSLSGKRIGSIFHFQAISGMDDVLQWSIGGSESRQRMQAAQLELSLKPEYKIIALVGESPHIDRLADSMSEGLVALDRRVLVLNSILDGKDVSWERQVVPASTRPGWWFSPAAAALLQAKSASYDRIIVCLPPLDVAPESAAAIRQAHLAYFLLQNQRTKVTEWRRCVATAQEFGIDTKPVLVTQV